MAIDFGRMIQGVATGAMGQYNAEVAAKDKIKGDIIKRAGLNFYENTVFIGEQIMINLPMPGGDLDKVTSGPYVVLEIKHKFSENKYSQAMTCSKLTNSTDKTLAVGPTGYTNI